MTRTQKPSLPGGPGGWIMGLTVNNVLSVQGPGRPHGADRRRHYHAAAKPSVAAGDHDRSGRPAGGVNGLKDKWSLLFFGNLLPGTSARPRSPNAPDQERIAQGGGGVSCRFDPGQRRTESRHPRPAQAIPGYFDPSSWASPAPCGGCAKGLERGQQARFPADTSKPTHRRPQRKPGAERSGRHPARLFRAPLNNQKLVAQLPGLLQRK